MRLTISTNFPDVDRALAALPKEVGEAATRSTLNKVTAQAQTQMRREITSEFNITASKVRERLFIKRASLKGGVFAMQAELYSYAKRRALNVINFGGRQVKGGVSVKIRKIAGRQVISDAFIGNKGRTVFKRVGKTRLPIKPVQTIDVAQMFNARRINGKVVRFIERRLPEIWQREAAFYMSRFGK